ncbi:hypothetical protein H2198_009362 [Neophaeococcomyces mojaviensis]|uniref:Uncharacterized protein n=1 Tax=Neophaeococcomyces mojaviensis TaxID=3383035 RepID=A0ACC2ZUW7_9EURO|nr:hypothetical protein H2198_009362 [Knufia sp. JES_112]
MSYQQDYSQFLLEDNCSNLGTTFGAGTDDSLFDIGGFSAPSTAINPSFPSNNSLSTEFTIPQQYNKIPQNQALLQNNHLQSWGPHQLPIQSQHVQTQPKLSTSQFQQWGSLQPSQIQQTLQGHQYGQNQQWVPPQQSRLQHYGVLQQPQSQQYGEALQQFTSQQAPFFPLQKQQSTPQFLNSDFIIETPETQRARPGPKRSTKVGKGVRTGPYTKAKQRPQPKTLAEADAIDKMVWRKKHEGLSWSNIYKEHERMTGEKLGHSTLGVRFGKMEKDFARNSEEVDNSLLRCTAQTLAEFRAQLWPLIARKMREAHPELCKTPRELASRWRELVGGESGASPLSLETRFSEEEVDEDEDEDEDDED